ncbi:MAG TPA: NAD-dependent epimerase/dehydratase family protein [Phycisphaeraceae bacterium]
MGQVVNDSARFPAAQAPSQMGWPEEAPRDVETLEEFLSRPTPAVVDLMARLRGDLLLLGAAGKMGPTLARMAKRATDAAGVSRRIIAVSRFSQKSDRAKLERWGIETIAGDLLDESFVDSLPRAENVVWMAGMKFGATGNESLTWAMNAYLPGMVCKRFRGSRIAAFSTGNVYGLVPVVSGGSIESDEPNPQGEYAMSCLGRERIFEHLSRAHGVPVTLLRLNYACELRYGVLVDLAQKIHADQPIDLSMGMVNVIWQGDANAMALLSLEHAASPARVLNLAGPETLSVRRVCGQLGELMGRSPRFTGQEQPAALLSNGQLGHELMGYPSLPIGRLIRWVAQWVQAGGEMLGKPTKFEVRDGRF